MLNKDPLFEQCPTINPYVKGFELIVGRFLWDIRPKSFISRARIKRLKNKYKGNKAVVVCNGPSLLKSNLDLLDKTFTFGLNKINLLFDKSKFRPSCIVSVNKFVIDQNKEFFNSTHIPLFISHVGASIIKFRNNVIFLHATDTKEFARDVSLSIYEGFTVTYVALQLAFHFGFDNIALIGCDHDFADKGPSNMIVESSNIDLSHFDPTYFSGGEHWQLPDLINSELFYNIAKANYEAHGKKIYNCTVGGKLNVYPRMTLDEFLAL